MIKGVKFCIYSIRFWQYFWLMLFSNYFGTFFMYTYKTFGENKGDHKPISDSTLTAAASIGSGLINGISRVTLGFLIDKYSFRCLFGILMILQLLNSLICYQAASKVWLYFICILVNYMCLGGMFAIFPVSVQNCFG